MSDKENDRLLASNFLPVFMEDKAEPFRIRGIGYTIFRESRKSASCGRMIKVDPACCQCVIEYAVYFDFDIQHLYDLEHVFIYLGFHNEVIGVETSFHGKFLNAKIRELPHMKNETHPVLYLQPGKHAIMPDPELFVLFPGVERACMEEAGSDGFLVADMFRGRLFTNQKRDALVRNYIKKNFAFRPVGKYQKIPKTDVEAAMMTYEELDELIYARMTDLSEKISPSGNGKRVFIGFMILMLALGASDALRGIFAPIFTEHFTLNPSRLSLLVTVSYAGNLVFLLVGGFIMDRMERKKAMLSFLGIWMAAVSLFIITDNYWVLLVGMFLAMGTSTLLNTNMNLVTNLLFATSPGALVGLLFFVQGIGTSGSQSIIGNVAEGFDSWKIVNLVLLGLGMISFMILLTGHLPNHGKDREAKEQTLEGKSRKRDLPALAIMRHPAFWMLVFLFGFYFIAEHGIMNWLVSYAYNDLGVSMGQAANYTAVFFGGITIGRLLFGSLVDRFGIPKCLLIFGASSTILYIVGVLCGTKGLWLLSISGLLISILYPTLVMAVPRLWPKQFISSASGMIISIASLADIFFNFAFGYLIVQFGYSRSFLLMPVAMLAFLILLFFFTRSSYWKAGKEQ